MPEITDNKLLGNAAEQAVRGRLMQAGCLVRGAEGDDNAVDLYCETVSRSQPFLHFWMQVKSGKQVRTVDDGADTKFDFKVDHLSYWARQPVPVFVALLPAEQPENAFNIDIHIVDMTSLILCGALKQGQVTQAVAASFVWRYGHLSDVKSFLDDLVPVSTGMLRQRDGVVTATPSLDDPYDMQYCVTVDERSVGVVDQQIRISATFSVISLRLRDQLNGAAAPVRRRLAMISEFYDDDPHWENFAAPAYSRHADGEFGLAVPLYQRAIDSIQSDPGVRDKPDWKKRVSGLESDRDRAKREERLI